jgi:hypothetical protein
VIHRCHAGCGTRCAPEKLLCSACWRLVPDDLAAEVTRTYEARSRHRDDTWTPWLRAARLAINAAVARRKS